MASVQLKNNASGTLDVAIAAGDTGIALTLGDGASFPTLSGGNWFYATIEDTAGNYEVVKVTARTNDSVTVTRAQEGTSAQAFAAGSRFELRVTAQSVLDAVTGNSGGLASNNAWTGTNSFADTVSILGGDSLRLYEATDSNYHSLTDITTTLTFKYNSTTYLTATSAGVVAFTNVPLVGAAAVYYVGGTDVAVTDGGTGSSTASGARTNLGVVIGTDVQAYHAALASIAGLSTGADKSVYTTASNTYATYDLTSFARTLLDDADAATARTTLGMGSISTQAASAVAVTGGTIEGLSSLEGTPKTSSETSGTLTTLSKNAVVTMTGNVTLNGNVFSTGHMIVFYSGSASRTITQGSSITMRLGGTSTTGTRTLAERTLAVAYFVSATEVVISGGGVS